MSASSTGAAIALAATASCGWFAQEDCEAGATRCRGDRVQECGFDANTLSGSSEPATTWRTTTTCKSDPQLGDFTCGVVNARATCIPVRSSSVGMLADGGVTLAGPRGGTSPWLRVDVSRLPDGGLQIDAVTEEQLGVSPTESAWGEYAALSTDDGQVIDATLVPFASTEATGTSVWLEGRNADAVSVVTSTGTTVASFSNVSAPTSTSPADMVSPGAGDPDIARSGMAGGDEPSDFAQGTSDWGQEPSSEPLIDDIPMGLPASVRVRATGASTTGPSPAQRAVLQQIFARVPTQLAYLLKEVILVSDSAAAALAGAAPPAPAAQGDAGAVPELPALRPAPASGFFVCDPFREASCSIDMRANALSGYASDTTALSWDINRTLADRYARLAGQLEVSKLLGLTAEDFPKALSEHLHNHLAPLLDAGEGLVSAWYNLHNVAVKAGLAAPYWADAVFTQSPKSAPEAVAIGFSAVAGSKDARSDVGEYVAAALVPERWVARPCEALRAKALDELDPPLLVHVAKLLALRGLALIGGTQLRTCVGELKIANPEVHTSGGIVLHKPDGTRIAFTNELEGLRQPYFQDELQLSWKAERAYAGLSISAGFRGATPGVMRFAAAGNGSDETPVRRAVLAFTNPDGYQTTVAKGGLLAISAVRRDALTGFGLMVLLSSEQAGTTIFPLVSAQVNKPVWGDAP